MKKMIIRYAVSATVAVISGIASFKVTRNMLGRPVEPVEVEDLTEDEIEPDEDFEE